MKLRAVTAAATLTAALTGAALTTAPAHAATAPPKPAFPHLAGLHQLTQYTKPAPIALPDGRRVAPNLAPHSGIGGFVGTTYWETPLVSGGASPEWCMTANGNSNGNQAFAAECDGSSVELWDVYAASGAGFSGYWYRFVSRSNGLCLDADATNITNNGDKVQTWTCLDGQLNQRWGTTSIANGQYEPTYNLSAYSAYYHGSGSAEVLDADSNYAGLRYWPLQLWRYLGTDQENQQWRSLT